MDFQALPDDLRIPMRHLSALFKGPEEDRVISALFILQTTWKLPVSVILGSMCRSYCYYQVCNMRLTSSNRPACVSHFLKKKDVNKPAPILDFDTFPDDFFDWWFNMQPSWRKLSGVRWPLPRNASPIVGSEWIETRKGGLSGIITVVMALLWWKTQAKHTVHKKQYVSALEDVAWVLEQMLLAENVGSISKRAKRNRTNRGRDEVEETRPRKRK